MNRNLIIGIVVLVLIGGYFLLASNQPKKTATITPEATSDVNQAMSPTSAMPTLATQDTTQKTAAASEKVTITAANYMFDLKEIKVKKGEPVTLTLMNKEGFHDFVIDEFNAKTKQLKAGESETITFTPNKVGTFEYYCSVGQHRQMGMKGNLIVE